MAKEFKLQDPGEGIHEAEILDVKVSKGDEVTEGDILLEVETDKAAVEIPSPFTGTLESVAVTAGDRARVGDVLMTYTTNGGDGAQEAADTETEGKEEKAGKKEKREGEEADKPVAGGNGDRPVPAAPATRRLARELNVDLRDVTPSGKAGRVTADDVRAHANRPREAEEEKPKRPQTPLPDFAEFGPVRREPLRSIRRATAEKMATSWEQIPHVMHADDADITELEAFRQENTAAVEKEGGKLTLTVLVLKAVVAALKAYPRFNASLDTTNQEIVFKEYFHIGVAVATDRGLLVPVVRDVDKKSMVELAAELTKLAQRARDGDIERRELQGASFTVTNPGGIGGTAFTPIINHPEVAILGVGAARLRPTVQGSLKQHSVVPRLVLPLCLAFDHRVNDGAGAARFVRRLVEVLADPNFLTLYA